MAFIASTEQFAFKDDFVEYLERICSKETQLKKAIRSRSLQAYKSIILPESATGKVFKELVKEITPHFNQDRNTKQNGLNSITARKNQKWDSRRIHCKFEIFGRTTQFLTRFSRIDWFVECEAVNY